VLLVSVVCCQVEVSATGRWLVGRRSTERGLSVTEELKRGGIYPLELSSHKKQHKLCFVNSVSTI
jgi:hypothetical protein